MAVQVEIHNERRESSYNWKDLRFKLFPVEILFTVYIFLVMFHPKIYKQLYFQRLAEDSLANCSNYTALNTSICLRQDLIVSYTSNATFEEVQRAANQLNMYSEVISLGIGSLIALIYGPLSDLIGRKPIFLSVFIGLLLAALMQTAVIYFRLSLYYNLLSVTLYSLGGGYATMTGITFAAVSDVTSKRWIAVRMGAVEAGISFGSIMSFLIGYNWLQSDNCDFLPPSLLLVAMVILGLLYILILPEPLSKPRLDTSSTIDTGNHGFTRLVNGAKLFFIPSYIGLFNWCMIWLLCIIVCLESLCEIGGGEIINYFLYNRPLQWSYRWIGYYGAYFNLLNALSLLVVLPILLAVGVSKYIILLIGIICAVVSNIVIANVKTTWVMIVAGGFLSIRDIGFPILRSMLALHVNPNDYGSVLTISSSMEALASSGSSVLFNEVYHPQATVNGHTFNAGIVFWISAGIWALNIPLVLLMCYYKTKKTPQTIQLIDEKPLLSSGDGSHDYSTAKK